MPLGENVGAASELQAIGERTLSWVLAQLEPSVRIEDVVRLRGGWTSAVRRLDVSGVGGERSLVLRSLVHPMFRAQGEGLLRREAEVLTLLESTEVPTASLVAVDSTAAFCERPSLLMSLLPGEVRLSDDGHEGRANLLARQLLSIHGVAVNERTRPRRYEAWTAPERVQAPAPTERHDLWRRVVDLIRRDPPEHIACFLHRDFHPGNVLFVGSGQNQRVSGVVDWVETSWGPADLDIAHCSTNLALLHGVAAGMSFAERYIEAGGRLDDRPRDHLYWRLVDTLAFAPDAEKVAVPWRQLGRSDLTDTVVARRLEDYLQALVDRYD